MLRVVGAVGLRWVRGCWYCLAAACADGLQLGVLWLGGVGCRWLGCDLIVVVQGGWDVIVHVASFR